MTCRICGKYACTESFHSPAEQEKYEEVDSKLVLKEHKEEKEEEAK